VALDARTGELRWHYTAETGRVSSLVVSGETLLMQAVQYVYALDARTGQERWRRASESIALHQATAERLYIGGLGCSALDTKSGRDLWRHPTGGRVTAVATSSEVA